MVRAALVAIEAARALAQAGAQAPVTAPSRPYTTWSSYLGSADSAQYTALDQIDVSNVNRLEVAWTFPTGSRTFPFNPLVADGLVIVLAGANDLVALDARTGTRVWSRPHDGAVCARGINSWHSADGADRRLLYLAGGYLTAADARTRNHPHVRRQRPRGSANGARGQRP